MSLHTFTTNSSNSAGSGIAAWAQGVSNGFIVAGLVRVAGSHSQIGSGAFTGASDFSALSGAAINTQLAWEIWRFADTLQSTTPVYIYVGYGGGAAAATPSLWLQVGFALNAGQTAVIGQSFALAQLAGGGNSTTNFSCFVSGTTARILVALFADTTSNVGILFGVERTHNADGTDNEEGLFVFTANGSAPGTHNHQVVSKPSFGGNGELQGVHGGLWPFSDVTSYGSDFHVSPSYPIRGRLLAPSRNVMLASYNDVPNGTVVSLPLYGATRQWFASKGAPWTSVGFGAGNSAIFLLRYE
jgi:hypothetical protein